MEELEAPPPFHLVKFIGQFNCTTLGMRIICWNVPFWWFARLGKTLDPLHVSFPKAAKSQTKNKCSPEKGPQSSHVYFLNHLGEKGYL